MVEKSSVWCESVPERTNCMSFSLPIRYFESIDQPDQGLCKEMIPFAINDSTRYLNLPSLVRLLLDNWKAGSALQAYAAGSKKDGKPSRPRKIVPSMPQQPGVMALIPAVLQKQALGCSDRDILKLQHAFLEMYSASQDVVCISLHLDTALPTKHCIDQVAELEEMYSTLL